MKLPFTIIIPARYQASRLPGKLLLDIAGKPVIQHVYERAKLSQATNIIVATDDKNIADVISNLGGQVCMTGSHHKTGTDRLGEVIQQLNLKQNELIVNVQGDEPLIDPKHIDLVATNIQNFPQAAISTICEPMNEYDEIINPNRVKVVLDKQGYALYFSRAPIAWDQKNFSSPVKTLNLNTHYRHIGLYAYRAGFINQYLAWGTCPLEKLENIEQLRVLWHGHKIHVAVINEKSLPGIDTAEDLSKVRALYQMLNNQNSISTS